MENLKQLLIAIDKFMDIRAINSARHSSQEADTLACEIERLMTELGCYDDEGKLAAATPRRRQTRRTTMTNAYEVEITEQLQITVLESIIRDYVRALDKLDPTERRAEIEKHIANAEALLNDLCDVYDLYRPMHN